MLRLGDCERVGFLKARPSWFVLVKSYNRAEIVKPEDYKGLPRPEEVSGRVEGIS